MLSLPLLVGLKWHFQLLGEIFIQKVHLNYQEHEKLKQREKKNTYKPLSTNYSVLLESTEKGWQDLHGQ